MTDRIEGEVTLRGERLVSVRFSFPVSAMGNKALFNVRRYVFMQACLNLFHAAEEIGWDKIFKPVTEDSSPKKEEGNASASEAPTG